MARQRLCSFLNNRMTRRNRSLLLAMATLTCAASGCVRPGEVIDSWETRSPLVTVRVRKFEQTPQILQPQYFFAFEVRDEPSHGWRRILLWMVDDPISIQREQVKFVTDSIVYAFGNWKYVVTTDAGQTWAEWDAKKALPQPEAYVIRQVLVSEDGSGTMVVKRRTSENNGLAELSTSDFGVHWTLKEQTASRQ